MAEGAVSGLESRLARLESIVAELDREGLELDVALALFEEGIAHIRAAEQLIRSAELRVAQLLQGADGEPEIRPIDRPEP